MSNLKALSGMQTISYLSRIRNIVRRNARDRTANVYDPVCFILFLRFITSNLHISSKRCFVVQLLIEDQNSSGARGGASTSFCNRQQADE